jgi:hypothetical protein
MLVMCCMLFALGSARITRVGARGAHHFCERAAARHDAKGSGTSFCTVPVEPNAECQHFRVLLVETGIAAHFTGNEAFRAGLDAVVIHGGTAMQIPAEFDNGHVNLHVWIGTGAGDDVRARCPSSFEARAHSIPLHRQRRRWGQPPEIPENEQCSSACSVLVVIRQVEMIFVALRTRRRARATTRRPQEYADE